jgi:hypothetical protein
MKLLRSALDVLRRSRRPYLILRLVYYGLIVWTMVYVTYDRSIQERFNQLILDTLGSGPLASVIDAYSTGQALLAVALIFAINLVGATFLAITVPSLIIPFAGLLLFAVRALLWGILFAPQPPGAIGMPEVLTALGVVGLIVLEGEGYILGALGAFIQGRALLKPSSVGAGRPGQGYRYALREQARLYVWIVLVLLVAAVYEVGLLYVAAPPLP